MNSDPRVSLIRPVHAPDPAQFAELLGAATQHLADLGANLAADSPQLRAQLLTLAGQAAGVELMARRFLESLARKAA